MPATVWSAPVQGVLGATATAAPAVAAALTDISPYMQVIPAGSVQPGTRLRIRAAGNLVTSAATATPTWGFYMNQVGTAMATTPAILGVTTTITVPSSGSANWPWEMEYKGIFLTVTTSTGTAATIRGRGWFMQATAITVYGVQSSLPITNALATVTQAATGLVTNTNQNVFAVITPNVTTAFTSVTCEELTVELMG